MPLERVLLCFVKKLTVIGIIGNTHGVKSAAKPPKKLKIKIVRRPRDAELASTTSEGFKSFKILSTGTSVSDDPAEF